MKSHKMLQSFINYCQAYPEQRFWQALRNWSGYHFIISRKVDPRSQLSLEEDTFCIEDEK